MHIRDIDSQAFPSPYGAWVLSYQWLRNSKGYSVSVPLRGMGCIIANHLELTVENRFRPLTGHGLYPGQRLFTQHPGKVSVPLRGMGCISLCLSLLYSTSASFRPLTGHGLYLLKQPAALEVDIVSVPLRGMGCISKTRHKSVH